MMTRTIVLFVLITCLMAKKYLIEVDKKAAEDEGEGLDYSSLPNLKMEQNGQLKGIIH